MSSLCGRLHGSDEPAIWAQPSVDWLSLSPPYPTLVQRPGQRDLENLAPSSLATLHGMAAANPVLQPSSSRWIKPAQEQNPSVVLKRAREPPLSLGWTLGQRLVAPKKKAASASPVTPRDEVLGEVKPWLSHSWQNNLMPYCCCYWYCAFKWIDKWVLVVASNGRCQQNQAQTTSSSGQGMCDFLVLSPQALSSSPCHLQPQVHGLANIHFVYQALCQAPTLTWPISWQGRRDSQASRQGNDR